MQPAAFTKTVFGFLIASASLFGLAAITTFGFWGLLTDSVGVTDQELFDAAALSDVFIFFAFLSMLVVAILFVVWFNLAYKAAKSRGADGAKWGSGWTIGAWFTPILFWYVPKALMNQVDRMSQSDLVEPIGETWKGRSRFVASDWWWGTWIAAGVVLQISGSMSNGYRLDPIVFLVDAAGYALWAAAGSLLAVTVLTIGKRLKP